MGKKGAVPGKIMAVLVVHALPLVVSAVLAVFSPVRCEAAGPAPGIAAVLPRTGEARARGTSMLGGINMSRPVIPADRIVYSGVNINRIWEVDTRRSTCMMDFHLWFRYEGELDAGQIEFFNAAEPVAVGKPVEREDDGRKHYRLYRVTGRFRMDHRPGQLTYNRHTLGVSFRHRDLPRDRLMFVADPQNRDHAAMLARMRRDKVIDPSTGLVLKTVTMFQDVAYRNSLGNPRYSAGGRDLAYSGFNALVTAERAGFSIRGVIPAGVAPYAVFIGLGALLAMIYLRRTAWAKRFAASLWIPECVSFALVLLAAEVCCVDWQMEKVNADNVKAIISTTSSLWWLVSAYVVEMTLKTFFLAPMETRSGRKIPDIVYKIITFLVYLLAILGVVAFVFNQKLTGILATSGVLAMIIGLAIQMNISNVFSGIAINVERPFRVGDWVKIGDIREAQVVDMTWRTTRLRARDGCILSVPNSMAAEAVIHNFNYPDDRYELVIPLQVEPGHNPRRVIKIACDALQSLEFVRNPPDRGVSFRGYTEWSAEFALIPLLSDYAKKHTYRTEVVRRAWEFLGKAGMRPAIPRTEVRRLSPLPEGGGPENKRLALVSALPLFLPFGEKVREQISRRLEDRLFPAGKRVFRDLRKERDLFIIEEGIARVMIPMDKRKPVEVTRLGPGDFFVGDMFATGEGPTPFMEAVTEIRAFRLAKKAIRPFVEAQPDFFNRLKHEMTALHAITETRKRNRKNENDGAPASRKTLFHRVQQFFCNRRHERVRLPEGLLIPVTLGGRYAPVTGKLVDISREGMGVRCPGMKEELKLRNSLHIAIDKQGIMEKNFGAEAKVIFTSGEKDSRHLGLYFPRLPPGQKRLLFQLIDRIAGHGAQAARKVKPAAPVKNTGPETAAPFAAL